MSYLSSIPVDLGDQPLTLLTVESSALLDIYSSDIHLVKPIVLTDVVAGSRTCKSAAAVVRNNC